MDDWDGVDRRIKPHEYELRSIIREEMAPIKKNQADIQRKIAEWELGAQWFRKFVMGTVAIVGFAAAAYEWLKEHLR